MTKILIQNAALLITLSFLYGIIKWYRPRNEILYQAINGLWFGLVAIAAMMMPYEHSPGIIYDGRSVIMTLAGLWGGGLTTLISVVIGGSYRLYLGGPGVWAGLSTILFTGITGLLFRLVLGKNIEKLSLAVLFGIGIFAHAVMLASQLLLPEQSLLVIRKIWLPVIGILPVAFVFISKLFQLINGYINGYNKISEAEELYRTTLISIGDAVICTDKSGRINQMNAIAERLTGWAFPEVKGKNLEDVLHLIDEEKRQKVENPVSRVIASGNIVGLANHTILVSKDGREIPIAESGAPIKNKDEIIGVVLVFRDQSEEVKQQKLLRESEKLFREREYWLRESQRIGNIGTYDLDIVNNCWTSSQVLDEIFGIDTNDPHTVESWNALIHPDQQKEMLDYFINWVIKEKQPFEKEYRIIRQNDNEIRWVLGHGELLFDESGRPVRMFGTIQDITEKKQMFYDLLQAKEKAEESERLKSAFLANMSHEIRTPLNGIVGFTNLLAEDENLSTENKQEFAHIINKSTEGLLKIINDVLDFSRLDSENVVIEKKPFNLNMVLLTIYMLYEKRSVEPNKNQIKLILENPPYQIILNSDENRLIQVMSNLIDNALRFTNEGNIKFGVSSVSEEYVELFVSDTGIGIPKEKQKLIFDRFTQAESGVSRTYGGTGLGLAIVKKLVQLMGSEIILDSEPGRGSRFSFKLPFVLLEKEQSVIGKEEFKSDTSPVEQSMSKLKILIVEDNKVSSIYFGQILKNKFENLLFAESGNEALQLFFSDSPDIILMDVGLPDISGMDVVRKIREHNKKVLIIAQTAFALEGDEEKAIEAGCNDYITKPFKPEELLKKLKKYAVGSET